MTPTSPTWQSRFSDADKARVLELQPESKIPSLHAERMALGGVLGFRVGTLLRNANG